METIAIIFVVVLAGVGVGALASIHFAPNAAHRLIDGYHRLISYDPFQ